MEKNDKGFIEDSFSLEEIKVTKKNNAKKVDKLSSNINFKNTIKNILSDKNKKIVIISGFAFIILLVIIIEITIIMSKVPDVVAIVEVTDDVENQIEITTFENSLKDNKVFPKSDLEGNSINKILKANLRQFENLRLKYSNDDIKSYISVYGTTINTPVVQTENNTFYKDHDIYKNKNIDGTVYLDATSKVKDFTQNTIIYGRTDIKDKQFFDLTLYENIDFYKTNKFINLDTDYNSTVWQVVSFYKVTDDNFYLKTDFKDAEFDTFIAGVKNMSMYDSNVKLTNEDKILTLTSSNDNNNTNYVLQAKLYKIN